MSYKNALTKTLTNSSKCLSLILAMTVLPSLASANDKDYSLLSANCLKHQSEQLLGQDAEKVLNSSVKTESEETQPAAMGFLPSPLGMLIAPQFGQLGLYGEPLGGGPIGNEPTGEYNIQIGQLKFRASVSGGIMYNDNIGISRNKKGDFIFQLALGINGFWEVSEFNTLEIAFRTSYKKYVKNPHLDAFVVTLLPGAETNSDQLQFVMLIDNLTLTFYDRINLTADAFEESSLNNLEEFYRFQNTAGISALYDLTDVKITGLYEHGWYRVISPASLEHLDRSTDRLRLNVEGEMTHWITMGAFVDWTNRRFKREFLRTNSNTFNVGINATLQPADNIQIFGHLARTYTRYRGQSGSNTNLMTSSLSIVHQLNETMEHSLSFQRDIRPGLALGSNYLITRNFNYEYTWFANDELMLTAAYNLSLGQEEGLAKFSRQDIRLGVQYTIPPNWSVVMAYTHAIKDSDSEFNDYRRNTFGINSTYKF